MKTLKKRAAKPVVTRLRDSKGNVIAVSNPHMLDMPAYVRGMDAPDEMKKAREPKYVSELGESAILAAHIDTLITCAKDAYEFAARDTHDEDMRAMDRLHIAASRAYKAIAIIRKRNREIE